jgi:hypothetical protein
MPRSTPSLYVLLLSSALLLPLAPLLSACSSERGLIGEERPKLSVDPAAVQLPLASVAVGETGAFDVVLTNAGTAALELRALELSYQAPPGAAEATPAIRLDPASLPALPATLGVPGSGEDEVRVVTLLYTRPADDLDRAATLRVTSNDPDDPSRVVPITGTHPVPVLRVVPDTLDLGRLSAGQTGTRDGTLRNTGTAALVVDALSFTADSPDFVLTLDVDHVQRTFVPATDGAITPLEPALVLTPDQATTFRVAYTAHEAAPATARLVLFSNDPAAGDAGTLVQATANQAGACLQVTPTAVDFGGRPVPGQYVLPVEVANCSTTEPLVITRLELAGAVDGVAGPFALDLPPELGAGAVTAEVPLTVAPSTSVLVSVRYEPTMAAEIDGQGQPVPDTATLVLDSNAFVAHAEVPLSGFGVPDDCPVAVISVDEGDEVAPQTVLHLHGEHSHSPSGNVVKYQWAMEQPALSASKFVPSDTYPSPTFAANVLGKYVFHLDVWDEFGRKSCVPATAEVYAATGCALHVELLWTSPGDPNPDDEGPLAGTDVDLHLAHPNASQSDLDGDGAKDPWFDPSWDVFWFYPLQNWGSISSNDDNPSLDLDDVDGNGPENVNLCLPEDGKTYAVGVNYWDDHGFGTSYVTVRVYVYGSLVYQVNDLALVDHDLCWIADVDWPGGQVKARLRPDGGPWCTHDYHHPLFYQP